MACKERTQTECVISDTDGNTFDLRPLTRTGFGSTNWDVLQNGNCDSWEYEFSINVCAGLVNPLAGCTSASMCQVDKDTGANTHNLGSSPDLKMLDGNIVLELNNGDKCSSNGRHRMTRVTFECDPNAGPGQPIYACETDHCVYEVHWKTAFACKVEETQIADCEFDGEQAGNLAFLSERDVVFSSGGTEFEFAFCGAKKSKCRGSGIQANQGACVKTAGGNWFSLGSGSGADAVGNDYSYSFANGGGCAWGTKQASASINFECDYNGENDPVLISTDKCSYEFLWRTSSVCPAVFIPCTTYDIDNGKTYDLSPLKSEDDIELNDGEGGTMYINVCRTVVNSGCPKGSSVCTVPSDGSKGVSLGQLTPQTAIIMVPEEDVRTETAIMGLEGSKCAGTQGNTKTEIRFECTPGGGIGKPELLPKNGCSNTILWKTCLVCGEPGACGDAYVPPVAPPPPPSPAGEPPSPPPPPSPSSPPPSPSSPPPSPSSPPPSPLSPNSGLSPSSPSGNTDDKASKSGGANGGAIFAVLIVMAVMAAMGYMLWDPSRRERCVSFIPGLGGGDSPPGGGYKPMG